MSEAPLRCLLRLFDAALAAVAPANCLAAYLPRAGRGRNVVVGAGKAAASMALALEQAVAASWPRGVAALEGLVVSRERYSVPTQVIEVLSAAHPLPDSASVLAAQRILALASGLRAADQLLVLLSGGGSALLAAPQQGVSLEDKRELSTALLRSGAPIAQINCVRKHLSAIKGGRLALRAAPARVLTLAIPDVPGDHPEVIASGPTVADPSTREEALAILQRYAITPPRAIAACLADPACETPKPGCAALRNCHYQLIARPHTALSAAAAAAQAEGIAVWQLGDAIVGEAREVASTMAQLALACQQGRGPLAAPCVLLSGGETSVSLGAGCSGRGGRNTEFLLALALALQAAPGIWALAADTDGIDGSGDNAGAWVGPHSLALASRAGADAAVLLAAHDAYAFFAACAGLLHTGPTGTNVSDFRAILVLPASSARA